MSRPVTPLAAAEALAAILRSAGRGAREPAPCRD